MKLATGCALNVKQLLRNFPVQKLKFSYKVNRDKGLPNGRVTIIEDIFTYHFYLVVRDIIENNTVFHLPLVGKRKARIEPFTFDEEAFKIRRKAGYWENLDYIASDFKMYGIQLVLCGNRTPRYKRIYINKTYENEIVENVNKGMTYGGGRDRKIDDYFDSIMDKYEGITKRDIRLILNYCWRQYYMFVSRGCDILIRSKRFITYTGYLKHDSIKWFHSYIRKLSLKIRWLNKTNKKKKWDGYYYFSLSDDQYKETFGKNENKKGKRLSKFTFTDVWLYTYYDECSLRNFHHKYICRIPYHTWIKNCLHFDKLTTSKAELITIREPLKFKDILVSENEYDLL